MAKLHEGACTCPVCCPDKWTMNRLKLSALQGMSQTGIVSRDPSDAAIAEVLARLERIEAIITAHVKANDG